MNSEGLLLLTNDGALARRLEHPSSEIPRTYKVRIFGSPDKNRLRDIEKGLTFEGVTYRPTHLKIVKEGPNNTWLEITLYEGKNREIRNMMTFLGVKINRLIRLSYGPYHLNELKVGEVKETSLLDLS